ncbi:unnamed protein product, partial [Staurois parvus]
MGFEGNPHTKIKKKMAVGTPKIHTRPLSAHAAQQVRKGGGTSERSLPEPYQATCPQHGGCFWAEGPPPKHLVPMLMGTRASSPQPLSVVVGVCGGLIGIWKPPL